ncbi:hypothetical protein [Nonomuraea sp. NPDC049400]|uniref:hypothetical protein n=1 Tax=Nonomuraea sp. NPDC049400 TaxID=3364352 RepID=UPI0037A85D49
MNELREHLRRSSLDADADRREFLERLAENKTLALTPSGQLALFKSKGTWVVLAPAAALTVTAQYLKLRTKREALEIAAKLEAIRDGDGNPPAWASADLQNAVKDWRSADGLTWRHVVIDVMGQHDIDHGRDQTPIAEMAREQRKSREAKAAFQRRAAEGGHRIGDAQELVAGDQIELDSHISDSRRGLKGWTNGALLGGSDPPSEQYTSVIIRGTLKAPPKFNKASEWSGSLGIDWAFEPGATWRTTDGREGPLATDVWRGSEFERRVLFKRDEVMEHAAPTRESITQAGRMFGFQSEAVEGMAAQLDGLFASYIARDARVRFRELWKIPEPELNRLAFAARAALDIRPQAVAEIRKLRIGTPSGKDTLVFAEGVIEVGAIAAERRRRGLPDPPPDYVAGAGIARQMRDGETVDVASLGVAQLRGAIDYADGTCAAWADYLASALPDKDERASRWAAVRDQLRSDLERRQGSGRRRRR